MTKSTTLKGQGRHQDTSTKRHITLEAIPETSYEQLIFSVENTDRLDVINNFAPKLLITSISFIHICT